MIPETERYSALYPSLIFDPTFFSGKTDPKVFTSLLNDPEKPLFNRVIQTKYPPGSTWKMMMSMAAMGEGIITPTSTIACGGSFTYGNRSFEDHGAYGNINVTRAIEVSANVFYYKMGLAVGIDSYNKYGKMFGFGQKTGIDIPNAMKHQDCFLQNHILINDTGKTNGHRVYSSVSA